MSKPKNPLDRQVGGAHYKMGMQPIEFGMMNAWDFAACSVLKYVSRYRRKNGVEDLRKARHFVELRAELKHYWFEPKQRTPMSRYILLNKIEGLDAAVLVALESWVLAPAPTDLPNMLLAIDELIADWEKSGGQLSLLPQA